MTRYVLFCNNNIPNPNAIEIITKAPEVTILDDTASRIFLVEASEVGISWIRSHLKGWIIASETTSPHPHLPHHTIKTTHKR